MTEEEEKAMFRLKVCSDFAGLDNGTCIVNKKDVKFDLSYIEYCEDRIEVLQELLEE